MKNQFKIVGSEVFIYINRGPGVVAIIDLGDFLLVSSVEGTWSGMWSESAQTYYAVYQGNRSRGGKDILMHRLILGLTDPKVEGDHRDHNGLNNTRSNIRAVSSSVNKFNRRGIQFGGSNLHRNVYWHRASGSWHVQIKRMKKYLSYGYFHDLDEAAKVAEMAREELHATEA